MTIMRPVEVELKYLVRDPATAAWLRSTPSIGDVAAGPASPAEHYEDVYFDSAEGALARAGLAGRLRRTGAGTLVTIKSTEAAMGPLHRRAEWEAEAAPTLDPQAWPPSAPRSLVVELCAGSRLVELVTVRQSRVRRELMAGDTTVTLSLDEVEIVAAGRVVDRFTELEAELHEGDESRLVSLADVLGDHAGLVPVATSKFQRALAAATRAAAPEGSS